MIIENEMNKVYGPGKDDYGRNPGIGMIDPDGWKHGTVLPEQPPERTFTRSEVRKILEDVEKKIMLYSDVIDGTRFYYEIDTIISEAKDSL